MYHPAIMVSGALCFRSPCLHPGNLFIYFPKMRQCRLIGIFAANIPHRFQQYVILHSLRQDQRFFEKFHVLSDYLQHGDLSVKIL